MQPIKVLNNWLQSNANENNYLYSSSDMRSLLPEMSEAAFKTLLSRAVDSGILWRICRGLYIYSKCIPTHGLILYHAAAYLRSNEFNYISLETVLSDAGVISQIPINSIFIMTSGRSNVVSCGKFGVIEFVHTRQKKADIIDQLTYDSRCRLWRASVALALRDMRATHRNTDLIDWDAANEFI